MQIAIEATNEIVIVEGRRCRRWKGVTAKGVECDVFVGAIRARADADCSEFERELCELPAIDLRFLS